MAKKGINIFSYIKPAKKRRKGIHAKTKTSKSKTSKNYVKQYRGQGK
jgi:hypothetical protein